MTCQAGQPPAQLAPGGGLGYAASMLSVVIETHNDAEALARTLAGLVPGAVEEVIREVIVCDKGSTDQTRRVAEDAGCRVLADGGIAAAVSLARADWLLLLEPGARLGEGWIDAISAHLAGPAGAARFSRARSARTPFFRRSLAGNRALAQGLLIGKRQAAALAARAASAEALARGLATRLLPAEILVAPRAGK